MEHIVREYSRDDVFLVLLSQLIKRDLSWSRCRGVVDDGRRDLLKVARACFGMTGDVLLVERRFSAERAHVCFLNHFEMPSIIMVISKKKSLCHANTSPSMDAARAAIKIQTRAIGVNTFKSDAGTESVSS